VCVTLQRLPEAFFAKKAPAVARGLLGATLVHMDGGTRRAGRIVETEAYLGPQDLASHARFGPTLRSGVMFGAPGRAYVYRIYGIHECFNVVTEPEGAASAVLVRALAPVEGCMGSTAGPGRLCRALGISRSHNGCDLRGEQLFIEPGERVPRGQVMRGARIGVRYAAQWAARPLRFWIAGEPSVSRASR
jgi:DNA-3-methyladenine glycosylase